MVDKNCIFCKIAREEIKQEKVAENNSFFAVRDIKPTAPGHTLVISKKHYVTLLDIPSKLAKDMIDLIKKVSSDLLDEKYGDGFNIIMNNLSVAGQIVMHAHVHVIPRKEDDGLRFVTKVKN